jgi:hypothetical protein
MKKIRREFREVCWRGELLELEGDMEGIDPWDLCYIYVGDNGYIKPWRCAISKIFKDRLKNHISFV